MIVQASRLTEVEQWHLYSGAHAEDAHKACVMEAVCYVAGEEWSDSPVCACPVIGEFMRNWNDSLPDNETRDRLLKPLIARLVDSKSTAAVEERRSYMALDWLVRVHTPKFLDLVPSLQQHALNLRNHEEIADMAGAVAAGKLTKAAWAAARAAARAAAGAAAWAAAWDAARDAARAAARDAARAAARDVLRPTVEWLQISALQLVDRMLEVRS